MKNMRRLIGATLSMGLATLSTINIVACSNAGSGGTTPIPVNDDLAKSFNSNYKAKVDGSTLTLQNLGMATASSNPAGYDFIFNNLDVAAVNAILEPKEGAVITDPIYKSAGAQQLTPDAADKEIAVITGNDSANLKPDSESNPVVTLELELGLWKSVAKDATTYVYKPVGEYMDVDIDLTVPFRKDLNTLSDEITVKIDPAPSTSFADSFHTAVIRQFQSQAGFEDISDKNIKIGKPPGQDPVTNSDFNNGATTRLAINVFSSDDPGRFYGIKTQIYVNINYNMDLSGLPVAATFSIPTEQDMPAFLTALVGFWNQIAVFQTLAPKFVNVTLANGDPIPVSQLVKGATFAIKVTPSADPGGVTGFKNVNVTINS